MNIAFMLGGFSNYGGIGRATAVIASRLAREENTAVTAVCLYRDEADNGYGISDAVERTYLFDGFLTMKKALLKGAVKKLAAILREKKTDVVVACGTVYYVLALLAARRVGIKCVMWEHTHPTSRNDHFLQDEMRSFAARRADVNVLIADRAREIYAERFPKAQNIRIYNPLDPRAGARTEAYGREHKRILSVGRLSYPKNYELLIRIAGRILAGHEDWQWDIYGEGELRPELEAAIAAEGLVGRVNLMGNTASVYEVYQNYDFLVMTSRLEGFPMVLLEACANALPLVAFDIETGPREIITDGENGFLLSAFDEEGMIAAVRRLMEDPTLRAEFSAASLKTADRFSLDAVAEEWMALFGRLKGE